MRLSMDGDLRWLACAIDGEGSIMIAHARPRKGHPRREFILRVVVANTCRRFVEEARRIADIGRIDVDNPAKARQGTRIVYIWSVDGAAAAKLLEQVTPYLVIKCKQAELAISYPISFDGPVRGCKTGCPRIWRNIAQAVAWQRMSELNHEVCSG